jgi:hypothetical protein
MGRSENPRPPESAIGARVRIKPVHQSNAEALFADAGFTPIYKELRTDGNVSYWFGKDQVEPLGEAGVLERMPLDWWAHHAIIGDPPTIN